MATANFTFTTLTGTETAGWNSINTLITSIDTQLNASNRLIYMSGWSAVAGQTIKWDAANSRWVPGTLDAAALANNSVTEAKIATDAVTSGKIAADAVGSSEIAAGAVTLGKISPAGSTAGQVLTSTGSGSDPSWQNASIGEANIADGAVTENKIATDAVVDLKIKDGAVVTSKIDTGAVTYAKLNSDVKAYSIATSPSVGVYYDSNGNLAPDGTSTNFNYLVIADPAGNAGTITLTLDDAYLAQYAVTGQTITILQKTAGTTNIVAASGTTINGTTANYVMGGQYSVVTLIRIGAATWVITGDYI